MERQAINPTDWGLQWSLNQEAGTMPPQTLLGVSRLVLPELLIEIEATAGQ